MEYRVDSEHGYFSIRAWHVQPEQGDFRVRTGGMYICLDNQTLAMLRDALSNLYDVTIRSCRAVLTVRHQGGRVLFDSGDSMIPGSTVTDAVFSAEQAAAVLDAITKAQNDASAAPRYTTDPNKE